LLNVSDTKALFNPLAVPAGQLRRNQIKIGFFLHTPFPSSEVYRILPVRREILLGILYCDLIGFHTYDYVRHFLSSCARILGLSTLSWCLYQYGSVVPIDLASIA